MSNTVISVENVSKYYRLGLIGGSTLRADFERWWARVRGKPDPLLKIGQEDQSNRQGEHIWALRDVSFEVQQGEVLGIIGRNGAGKSTLLKILSCVTAPTSGLVKIKGRVASLLEVGTGFHPELTGRENIYLNGAILGMKRAEIERKFDEIVAFAEIEKFMDTPVKHYSSGMYVRLAFAVAAHLEPEILLVDEVLAVGDVAFQKKCLGKMGEVAEGGRTVLFISHNMGAIANLCPHTILLDNGRILNSGPSELVIRSYLAEGVSHAADVVLNPTPKVPVAFTRIWISNEDGSVVSNVGVRDSFWVHLGILVRLPVNNVDVGVNVRNSSGVNVFFTNLSDSHGGEFVPFTPGRYVCSFQVPGRFLVPDRYSLRVASHIPNVKNIDCYEDIVGFTVIETGSTMLRYQNTGTRWGCVMANVPWEVEKLQ